MTAATLYCCNPAKVRFLHCSRAAPRCSPLPVIRENFFVLVARRETKAATNLPCATRNWWPRGDESGGVGADRSICKHAVETANDPTRHGATGVSHTVTPTVHRSPAPRLDSSNGAPCCARRTIQLAANLGLKT